MEYFGNMERQKLLLQWKEEGSVKGLESAACFLFLMSFQHLELAETLILRNCYDLVVSLLCQRFESRRSSLGPLIFKV